MASEYVAKLTIITFCETKVGFLTCRSLCLSVAVEYYSGKFEIN